MSYTPPPPPESGDPGDQPGGIPYPGQGGPGYSGPGYGGPGYGGPGYGGPGYGGPGYGGPGYGAPRTNPKAVWALVLGIVGILCCGLLAGIPALILGNSAKREIAYSGGSQSGGGMAQAGVVLGIIAIVLTVLAIVVGFASGTFSGGGTTAP